MTNSPGREDLGFLVPSLKLTSRFETTALAQPRPPKTRRRNLTTPLLEFRRKNEYDNNLLNFTKHDKKYNIKYKIQLNRTKEKNIKDTR